MMDLWTLFVENVFGGFWMSVFGLCALIFMILALGRLSGWSIISFIIVFFLAMAIGYGYPLVLVLITLSGAVNSNATI